MRYVVTTKFMYMAKSSGEALQRFEINTITPKAWDKVEKVGYDAIINREIDLEQVPPTFEAREAVRKMRDLFVNPMNPQEQKVYEISQRMMDFLDAIDDQLKI